MPASENVTIPLNSTIRGFTLDVHIDGKPVRLLLDTGAGLTILSPETARAVGLNVIGKVGGGRSITGEKLEGQRAVTKRINIGAAWTENEPVFVIEMPQGANGVLGVATLADWDVRIDPSKKELTLFPAGKAEPLEGEIALPLACRLGNPEASSSNQHGHRILALSVPVHVGRHEVSATPDTGSSGTLLLPDVLIEELEPEVMKEALLWLHTGTSASGKIISRTVRLPEFTFGRDQLTDLPIKVFDATPGTEGAREGVVGLNLLRHYVITLRFSSGEFRLKPLGAVQEITRASTAGMFMGPDQRGRIILLSVVPDGPAAEAGLRAGDEILKIEGRPLKTITPEELTAFKQLPPGTHVTVSYRRGTANPVEATLILVKQ
ncbi:MAG TPA: aspartyl protease family protein [Verrucomicrobiales bacterium]|nr:aspartyl protease family protein [Verrucomicrobiales bacterium]